MRPRSLLLAATAAVALTALPVTAQAATTEYVDRAAYDGSVEQSASSFRIAGATRGELGGYLDVTVTAVDGSLPTGSNTCEPVVVDAVLALSPVESLSTSVSGEACTSFYGDATTVNAYFGKKDLDYVGTASKKAKVVGDGLLAASVVPWFGGQASFSAEVKW
ncbi:MAG TPA: hypothetical protein VK894_11680 [Jiangellales bacterium]|nr:hypothetical protein [Jiangellales bacterium]